MKTEISGTARTVITLLFPIILALAPLGTSYAFTHTVLGENASTTW